jgi:hypothetical protein
MKNEEQFKAACAKLNISSVLPDVSSFPEEDRESQLAFYMLGKIAKAKRGDFKANYLSWDQRKWTPVFEGIGENGVQSGFGFAGSFYVNADTCTGVGSRFAFETRAQSDEFGKECLELHNVLLTN